MQDGTPAHMFLTIRKSLAEIFAIYGVALNHEIVWPLQLSDLTL